MPNPIFTFSAKFQKQFKRLDKGLQKDTINALKALKDGAPVPKRLRLHHLDENQNPVIWKIDVTPNHSWQIAMIKSTDGGWSIQSVGRHSYMDRTYK